jgi:hypothetical protein
MASSRTRAATRRRWRRALTALVGSLVVAASASAQIGANLGGRVRDSTGGALPGATVTITNTSNGAVQAVTCGSEGNFRAVNLQPAPYEVRAELAGFGTVIKSIVLVVGSDQTVDFTLGVANLQENVTVAGATALVDVVKSQPSSVIDASQLAQLPVLSRNFLVIAQNMPGAAPTQNLSAGGGRWKTTKFGGVADQNGGYTTIIDGATVDDATWGIPVINTTQDAVQEFKVYRNQFDAQYGNALTAAVNVITKSGGEKVAGTTYYFGRDGALDAKNALAVTKPPFSQTRAGGTVGGPLLSKSTHFFAAYENLHINTAAILALPASNPFAALANGNYPFTTTENMADAKVDHRFGASNSMWLRYAYDRQFTPSGGPEYSSSSIIDNSRSHDLVVEDNWIISSAKVNTLRVDVLHHNLFTLPTNYDVTILRPSFGFGQNTVDPQYFPRTNFSVIDTLFVNTLRHDLKFGLDVRHASSSYDAHYYERGVFTFTTDAPFDVNNQTTWPVSMQMETPGLFTYDSNNIVGYVQDDWRIHDRVRLNLGLRYDLDTNLRDNDFTAALLSDPAFAGIENFVGSDRGNDYRNIQPRLGATWDVRGTGRLVLHGGFGRYSARNRPWYQQQARQQTIGAAVRITDPQQLRFFPDTGAVLGGKSLADYVAGGGARFAALIANDYVTPYSLNSTAGASWQVAANTTVNLDYVHNHSLKEVGTIDLNLPASGPLTAANPRPVKQFAQVSTIVNNGQAWYDALEVQFQSRVKGLDAVRVAYTYSKSMLDGVTFYGTYPGTQRTPQNLTHNPTDTPHNLSLNFSSATLPGRLQLSGIFRYVSGGPRTASAGFDLDGDLQPSGDRPPGVPQFVGRGDVDAQLQAINLFRSNPCAFAFSGVPCSAKPLPPVDRSVLDPQPIVDLDLRVTKAFILSERRRIEVFFEGFNLLNYTTKYGGNSSMTAASFLIQTSALDPTKLQWGARFNF